MKIIVGVTGASGVALAYKILEFLNKIEEVEVHLILSKNAKENFKYETSLDYENVYKFADFVYDNNDLSASIASGSNDFNGMVIIPCSMKTLAGIASGYAENLILRAADVSLKERRKLIIVPRETPLSVIHLRNMKYLAELGVTIIPPMLTFYNNSNTLDEQMDHIVGKVLWQLGIKYDKFKRWKGM
ncbi:UbiX family flavin prenyltransferase [Miniphocaeibacter halophilus]|uniref:UbiX family flavin prenyltransferase n=1 Tax=Miniphocaeibacter halophilus TaxID=2931922 RepID=A0AC61N207_9FIRM|nr:UbiX family flavin prenyltransferase [Miniphocaeibacter halophilus]QQK08808.1 UbiX family flavin prenyltransferase [Miniphocaeibacter halophilus]